MSDGLQGRDLEILQVERIGKSFAGTPVLREVTLGVRAGEVYALMGENGAGKSTLLRIIAGLTPSDSGVLRFQGLIRRFKSPHEAIEAGISMIHQELMPFAMLTVAENLFMGRQPAGVVPGWIDWARMREEAKTLLTEVGASIAPSRRMGELGVAEAQMVEIAKAVGRRASLIIMDEPTSSLSHHEAEALFRLMDRLRSRGTAIIYVSHKLDEVFRLADRVSVLRDGRHIDAKPVREWDETSLISRMVGRAFDASRRRKSCVRPAEVMRVEGLGRDREFGAVGFVLHAGEILGFGGLVGAGRSAVVSALFGLVPAERGTVSIERTAVRIARPRDGLRHGIGFVSEDRKQTGLVLNASVKHNLTLGYLRSCSRWGMLRRSRENAVADQQIRAFGIKVAGRDQKVGFLSGGNQQKVTIAKAALAAPKILILDEPTRGVDVGAKEEIYALIDNLAREGCGILLVSSELPELISLSDRILVMRQGAIVAELPGQDCSQEEILRHAMPN